MANQGLLTATCTSSSRLTLAALHRSGVSLAGAGGFVREHPRTGLADSRDAGATPRYARRRN